VDYSHPAVKIMKSGGRPLTVAYTQHYPSDTQACLFWLRNRRPQNWREKIDHVHRDAPCGIAELDAAGKRARRLGTAHDGSTGDAPAPDDAGTEPAQPGQLHHR
jgi:hypothetical protein